MKIFKGEINKYNKLHLKFIKRGQEIIELHKDEMDDWNGSEAVEDIEIIDDEVYISFRYEYECGFGDYCLEFGDWSCSLSRGKGSIAS